MVILIFLLSIINFSFALAQNVEDDVDPYAIAEIAASGEEGPREKCNNFVIEKGWTQMEEISVGEQKIMVVCGFATVNEPPQRRKFLVSRTVAFDKALLDAQLTYAEFKSKTIQENIITVLQEGFGKDDLSAIEKSEKLNSTDENIFKKLATLAHAEVNKKLKKANIDLSNEKEKLNDEIKNLVESQDFTKTIKTSTQISLSGIQSYKVWEECKAGSKQCKVAILALRTGEQTQLASALIGDSGIVRGRPGKPLPKRFSNKQVLANVGVRVKRDEEGNYNLLATAISVPNSDTGASEKIAFDKAKAQADGLIRRFAGAQIESDSELTQREIFQASKDGKNENELRESFKQKAISSSVAKAISGIGTYSTGTVVHPANTDVIAKYVTRRWSLKTKATALENDSIQDASGSDSVNKTDINNSSPIESDMGLEGEAADF
tara:strand:- start:116 stop:1423 length:1308 start_codon:yes stop_codon:yes gene_type:complete